MQNFLTDSQTDMARKVVNTNKFDTVEPYFLFFGRLSKEKGILTLVRAFLQTLPELSHDWTLHIVGDGPERETIEQLIARSGAEAENRIKMLGYKTGEELQREVGNARFSVLCSEWRENMPYSGLESLAAQTPVIGANIGGIPELVVEGKTGFQFGSTDSVGLGHILRQAAATDKDAYKIMQNACAEYISKRCLGQFYTKKMIDIYTTVMNRDHSAI